MWPLIRPTLQSIGFDLVTIGHSINWEQHVACSFFSQKYSIVDLIYEDQFIITPMTIAITIIITITMSITITLAVPITIFYYYYYYDYYVYVYYYFYDSFCFYYYCYHDYYVYCYYYSE
jgi:hypothetical protein